MRSQSRDIVSWSEGTKSLSADEYRVYDCIIQSLYMAEGPLPFNEKELAARCNMSPQRLRKSASSLIALHKIWIRDGRIYNLRVLTELSKTIPNCPEWDLTPNYEAGLGEGVPLQATKTAKGAPKSEVAAAFTRFWNNRARRKGGDPRHPCEDKFAALVASGVTVEAIEAGMKRHIAALRSTNSLGTEFTPMTRTWLNQQGFRDDPPQTDRQNVVQLDPARFTADDWAPILRLYAMSNSWKSNLHGPEPGRAGCLVPSELLAVKRAIGSCFSGFHIQAPRVDGQS